jgi:RNA polymerase sigma-70 factor, ECF subfamily
LLLNAGDEENKHMPGETNPEDRELVLRLQAGDLEALGLLYDRFSTHIFRTALALTADEDLAQDVLQECLLRVHQYAHSLDPNLPLAPWLYRVAVNCSHTLTRKRKRTMSLTEAIFDRLFAPSHDGPEHRAESKELSDYIYTAIQKLPEKQRVVVVLYYVNGLSVKEIAGIVNCNVATVKTRLFHARARLRQVMDGKLYQVDEALSLQESYLSLA